MADDQSTADGRSGPSVIRWALTAWRDAFAAIQQMPVVLAVAFVAELALNFLAFPFFQREFGDPTSFGTAILILIGRLANGLLLTPAALAVHRFILLGERAATYRLELSSPRFRRFFLFAAVIEIVIYGPGVLASLVLDLSATSDWILLASFFGELALLLAGLVFVVRSLLLFPAIDVDAPGADWSSALHDTRGHFWRTLLIVAVAGIPLWPVYVLLVYLQGPGGPVPVGALISAVLDAIFSVLFAALYAALASRMFAAFADRLARASDEPSPGGAV